ncbi:CU044_5270 family protein [Streptomyces sp. ODS28]|uniref:CU044_5270 family protein n=1 Tax=Streptomyces sp. ODS28 TaxID=3136688 RepID=UPI0031E6DF0C
MTDEHTEGRGDREQLARLLPAPAEWDLPRERHLHHQDVLMRHIDDDLAAQATEAAGATDRQTAGAPQPAARPARRLPRPALLLPATALTLAGALTAGVALSGGSGQGSGSGGQGSGLGQHDTAADMQPAAALLHRISDAARKRDDLPVRDDQYLYTREKSQGAELASGKAEMEPLKEIESWTTQKQGRVKRPAYVREDGKMSHSNGELGDTGGTPAGINRPTYRWFASLPTDPDELLEYLRKKTPHAEERGRDQAVFEQIGSLLGSVMPPRTAAALYQAAGKIPGVVRAPRAHDAIGRHGLGIAREDKPHGVRTEWVFNRKDLSFLGSRSYLTKDLPYGKKGTLLSSDAMLENGVADKPGARPTQNPDSQQS